MSRQLIINAGIAETRVAVLENDSLAEIHIERARERGIVGNIYLGKVKRVLPGMQAAFVEVGLERSAFLYGGDVLDPDFVTRLAAAKDLSDVDSLQESQARVSRLPIEKCLKEGQDVLVQAAKEPLGSKGARVTMFVSLPGRYLVLIPNFTHIGVSRRIDKSEERDRLKDILHKIKPDNIGIIVRTAAAGVSEVLLQRELKYLCKLWKEITSKEKNSSSPAKLYEEPELYLKVTRDLFADDITQVVVDDEQVHTKLQTFLDANIPGARKKLKLHEGANPIFDDYGVEVDLARALGRKVWLPSGGYLVIDQTEALTSFDVNTGKFVGKISAQETILQTNLEAVAEIVSQLRLRNIGGIIVLDFIDMERADDRDNVSNTLLEALKNDKARTNVLAISELGLVQMTRKRTSESLEQLLMEACPFCDGRGRVYSVATEGYNLIRDVERFYVRTAQKHIKVKIRSDIREWLLEHEKDLLEHVSKKHGIEIEFTNSNLRLSEIHEPPYEVLGG